MTKPDKLNRILFDAILNGSWLNAMVEEQAYQEAEPRNLVGAFPCAALSPSSSAPTSVHRLRPSDIKIIAGIGDSYVTNRGGGGRRPLSMFFDYRGNSFCMGGNKDYDFQTSLPNILREYNDDLFGFARGAGDCQSNFDMSVIGKYSNDFVDQANNLIKKLKDNTKVDFENDWKLITVFLGSNDLCNFCLFSDIDPASYLSNMRAGLDILYNNIPRTFVNLVQLLPMAFTQTLKSGLFISNLVLGTFCKCAAFPDTQEVNMTLANYTEEFQQGLLDIANSGDYDNDNFTVVLQRFFENFNLPYEDGTGEIDRSFFTPDGLHFSKKGNALLGRSLWNSMFQPVGNKTTEIDWTGTSIFCPSEDSQYLLTSQNSDDASYMFNAHYF